MVDKIRKAVGCLTAAGNLSPNKYTESSVNTGPEIPGHNPKGKSNLYEQRKAVEEAREEVSGWNPGTLAADSRTTEEIVRDEAVKRLQKYR